jgi:hypothetical protein
MICLLTIVDRPTVLSLTMIDHHTVLDDRSNNWPLGQTRLFEGFHFSWAMAGGKSAEMCPVNERERII